MYKFFVISLTFFIFTGCATPPVGWFKPGVTNFDTETALAKCKYEVGINNVKSIEQQELIKNCMKGQGYRWY